MPGLSSREWGGQPHSVMSGWGGESKTAGAIQDLAPYATGKLASPPSASDLELSRMFKGWSWVLWMSGLTDRWHEPEEIRREISRQDLATVLIANLLVVRWTVGSGWHHNGVKNPGVWHGNSCLL